jgi:hypothetical protein
MVSEVFEVEALVKELLPGLLDHLLLPKHGIEYAPVFYQSVVDVPDDGTVGGLELIVICVATIIIAELLICPSV